MEFRWADSLIESFSKGMSLEAILQLWRSPGILPFYGGWVFGLADEARVSGRNKYQECTLSYAKNPRARVRVLSVSMGCLWIRWLCQQCILSSATPTGS